MTRVLLSILAGVLLAIGVQKATTHYFPAPISAVGVAVCGQFVGAAITYSNGKVDRLSADDETLEVLVDAVPEDQRALLSAVTPACKTPQVY